MRGVEGEPKACAESGTPPRGQSPEIRSPDPVTRQFNKMVSFTQALIRKSPDRRKEFWAKANSTWPGEPTPGSERERDMLPSEALETQWSNSREAMDGSNEMVPGLHLGGGYRPAALAQPAGQSADPAGLR